MASSGERAALADRTALITGASSGIGFAVAQRMAAAGVRVAMVARRKAKLGEAAEAVGGVALAADVADPALVERLPRRFRSVMEVRAPDFLVSAAGVFALAPVAETDPAVFERHLAVNLRGPFHLMRAFLPAMLARGSGHVVTIGSVAGRRAFPANGAYSASKFGVRGLHAVLELELKGTGVRSTLVEPAATDTSLWDEARSEHDDLPGPDAMLDVDAVADAVIWAVTRPVSTGVRNLLLERA